jgi:outer membrane immunogenic protein
MPHRLMLLTTAAALVGIAAPAAAQDQTWTGFYIGANLGADWGDTSLKSTIGPGTGPIVLPPVDVAQINQTAADDGNKSGFTGGVQLGYNYQMGSWLFGIETDYGFIDLDQHRTNTYQSAVVVSPPITPAPPVPTYTLDQRVQADWIWTVRPRLGYASGPWMVYATGGIATSKIKLETKYSDTRIPPNSGELDESDTKTGWVLGFGGAWAFTPNWSVRGEYLYADFGHVDDSFTTANGFATLASEAKVKANFLRIGVDYKF